MKQVVPVAPPCPTWTGFYVGAFGGYDFAATDLRPRLGGDWNGPIASDIADRNYIESVSPRDLNANGALLGGLIGYNYQWNKWVFGVEGTGAYTWLRKSNNTGIFTVPSTGDAYSESNSFKTHYIATFGPRIGYTFCHFMPYVTAGLAVADVDFKESINQFQTGGQAPAAVNFGSPFFQNTGSTHDTRVGYMVGAGLEYALCNHWRVRAAYQFDDLGSTSFHTVGTGGSPGYTTDPRLELREHSATFAIIYAF